MNINLTLIGQTITFVIFVWFCFKFIWPPILAAMAEREKKISDGLNAAETARKELADAHEQVEQELGKAREEAASVLEQANKRARQMVEEAKETASAEGARIRESAQAEIDLEISRAKEALRKDVSKLALAGAEQILQKEIDENGHRDLLDKLAANL